MAEIADSPTFAPRFTIRTLLVTMAVSAMLFVVIGVGFRGQAWAWGFTIGILSLGLTTLVHAACFGFVWCFARVFGMTSSDATRSVNALSPPEAAP